MEEKQTFETFYASQGLVTDPGDLGIMVEGLPPDLPGLVMAMQSIYVHIFWAKRYGLELNEERQAEVQLRLVRQKLVRLRELSPEALAVPRPVEKRLVCNCRDISTLLVSVLRGRGIPARARCGFGTYFIPDHFEDHWVCEVWDERLQRWRMFDAQLDALQREVLDIHFDALDMPAGEFVLAGEAWQMARRGEVDPDQFGIFDFKGMDFIRGNVLRDLCSLNKIEMLPWDFWGLMDTPVAESSPALLDLVDRAAALTLAGNGAFQDLRTFYQHTPEVQVPAELLVGQPG